MGHQRKAYKRRPPGSPPWAAKTVDVRGTTVKDRDGSGGGNGGAGGCGCIILIAVIWAAVKAVQWVGDLFHSITN